MYYVCMHCMYVWIYVYVCVHTYVHMHCLYVCTVCTFLCTYVDFMNPSPVSACGALWCMILIKDLVASH